MTFIKINFIFRGFAKSAKTRRIMAHKLSTKKRIRQARKANLRNRHYKSLMKTAVKTVQTAEGNDAINGALKSAVSVIDRLVQKGILHKNNGANRKSKLSKAVNARLV